MSRSEKVYAKKFNEDLNAAMKAGDLTTARNIVERARSDGHEGLADEAYRSAVAKQLVM